MYLEYVNMASPTTINKHRDMMSGSVWCFSLSQQCVNANKHIEPPSNQMSGNQLLSSIVVVAWLVQQVVKFVLEWPLFNLAQPAQNLRKQEHNLSVCIVSQITPLLMLIWWQLLRYVAALLLCNLLSGSFQCGTWPQTKVCLTKRFHKGFSQEVLKQSQMLHYIQENNE